VEVDFRKSSYSASNGCVEVEVDQGNEVLGPVILVRDSKDPNGPVLEFNATEWDAFLKGAKDGEFDLK